MTYERIQVKSKVFYKYVCGKQEIRAGISQLKGANNHPTQTVKEIAKMLKSFSLGLLSQSKLKSQKEMFQAWTKEWMIQY